MRDLTARLDGAHAAVLKWHRPDGGLAYQFRVRVCLLRVGGRGGIDFSTSATAARELVGLGVCVLLWVDVACGTMTVYDRCSYLRILRLCLGETRHMLFRFVSTLTSLITLRLISCMILLCVAPDIRDVQVHVRRGLQGEWRVDTEQVDIPADYHLHGECTHVVSSRVERGEVYTFKVCEDRLCCVWSDAIRSAVVRT